VSTVRFLLDTNIASFIVRRASPTLERHLQRTSASQVALSVVTEMELRYGLARRPGLRVAPMVEALLEGITILPFGSEAARRYATLRVALEGKGQPIGTPDAMIAAHALSLDLTLVSNNLREFRRVPGLRCQDWTR
jgi:tRNA(fMet)-specific endonuclease VapC